MDPFSWKSESDEPAPTRVSEVDDRLTAAAALGRIRRGEHLLYTGDFHNAKQLLGAMGRRLRPRHAQTPLEAFRAERLARELEHQTLGRILVALDREYRLGLHRAPDVAEACRWVWGEPEERTLVSFKQLLGMLGAAEWRRKGLPVLGLTGSIHPHYGVYLPTRTDYVELLVSSVEGVEGKRVFDVGAGTGVLAFLLLQRGAASAVATDCEPRAVACAKENAQALGLGERIEVLEADLFPQGTADLVVTNPPWIPEPPKNRVDRAVFDEDSAFLRRFLEGLRDHLAPGGQGLLLLSDLAVLLGLRPAGWLQDELARCGLAVKWKRSTPARHGKAKDPTDPLHAIRSREVTTLYCLAPA